MSESDDPAEWEQVESPTEQTINDVVYTADGPYAVGEGGMVLTRDEGSWVTVIDSGPNAANNPLHSVDVTDDGERIYFAGGSGAVGAYDVLDYRKHDYSAPTVDESDLEEEEEEEGSDKTSTWEGIAVMGDIDEEYVLVANGSGEVLDGQRNDNGCLEWGEVTEPAGGSTVPELHFADDPDVEIAYGVDTSQEAFETESYAGDAWDRIGIAGAQGAFYDVVGDDEVVFVAADGGLVYRYDCNCGNWTPVDVSDNALQAIDRDHDGDIIVAGAEGAVHERTRRWRDVGPDVDADLLGVAYGDTEYENVDEPVDVAVGQGGIVVERA